MKKIAILCSTDYNSYPVGGMMSFIKDAAPIIAKRFNVEFWGVDAGAGVSSFASAGQIFPIRFFGSVKTKRKIVPNMLRVTWHLWRNRKALLDGGYDGIYIHGIPLNAALPVSPDGPKRINHVHGLNNPFKTMGAESNIARGALYQFYEYLRRSALRNSDLVFLAADQEGVAPFQENYPTSARLVPLPNFCDTATFGMHAVPIDRSDEGFNADDRILLYVGRLSKEKDPVLAVRILAALHAAHQDGHRMKLVMIGGGVLLNEVEAKAKELGMLPHLRLLGMQPRRTIAQWMRSADLLLLTSYFEGFPVVLAEAAQCGLPMVCPDITGVHDLVVPGETGFVVASRTPTDFVVPIAEVLANRVAYGARLRAQAAQYTPDHILDRLCQEISDVL